jgi:spore coat polysaccharide biosynthesis predicted glycosyltransferase SpsG
MTLVALIADGGPGAGLGHLSRCSALALALRGEGALVRALGLGLEAALERYGVGWEPADEPDAAGAAAIVIDSYRATEELRVRLASIAPLVAFVDDDRPVPEAALAIRSGPAESSRAERELAGPRYACLGPEFQSTPPHSPSTDVQRVLVTTGGGDHTGTGPSLANRLAKALPSAAVTLVRGPYAPPPDVLAGIRVAVAPDSLFDLLVEADLVVSAAGQTMLEALAVGTPCIALVTADNQARQADELRSSGALTVAGSVERAVTASRHLAADLGARRAQVRAGLAAVDGLGAMRTASAILRVTQPTFPSTPSR